MSNPQGGNVSAPCAFCDGMCGNPDALCYTMPDMTPGQGGQGGNSTSGGASGNNADSPSVIDRVTLPVLYGCAWQAIAGMYAAILLLIVVRESTSFFIFKPVATGTNWAPVNRCGCRVPCSSAASTPSRKRSVYEADAALRERLVPGGSASEGHASGRSAAGSINGGPLAGVASGAEGDARGVVFSMPVVRRGSGTDAQAGSGSGGRS